MNFPVNPDDPLDWNLHVRSPNEDHSLSPQKQDFFGFSHIGLDSGSPLFNLSNHSSQFINHNFLPDAFLINENDFCGNFNSSANANSLKQLPETNEFNFDQNIPIAFTYPVNPNPTPNSEIKPNNSISSTTDTPTSNFEADRIIHLPQQPFDQHIRPIQTDMKFYNIPDLAALEKSQSNEQLLMFMRKLSKLANGNSGISIRNAKSKTQPLPSVPHIFTNEDLEFETVCKDKNLTFNPKKLGFIPSKFWEDKEITFGELVANFFKRKSNSNNRFYHKLFNALRISDEDSFYSEYVGVEWITPQVIRVNKLKFARLLGIKSIDGSLFHHQGNFPSHGFSELSMQTVGQYLQDASKLESVDFDIVRLLVHQSGVFVQGCTEDVINDCKWINARKGQHTNH